MTDQECNSRNIPLPIQREVRQRCGFGCVLCGLPLYEYEHMLEWADVKRHVAEEITLLCDQHHREKTSGLLPKSIVTEANKNPYNLRDDVEKPYTLHFSGPTAEVFLGSNSFTCNDQGNGMVMVPLAIDDATLIGITLLDGHLLLNILIFNEFNELVFQISDNQLIYATLPWDIQLVGTTLTIREAHRKILVEIKFCPPNKIIINRARILYNGVEVIIHPTYVLAGNGRAMMVGSHVTQCYGGIILGRNLRRIGGFMSVHNISRYPSDRTEVTKFEEECKGL